MDWDICVLCQVDGIDIIDPLDNLTSEVCGYKKLADNMNAFINKGLPLPNKIRVAIVDLQGETGIATNLRNHRAKWHKSCALELSTSKLNRACISRDKKNKR